MRPQKADYIVELAIEAFLKEANVSKLYAPETMQALLKLDEKSRLDHERIEGISEPYDDRDPYVTIGYAEPVLEMSYISDRFNAPHRLNWLIAGIKNGEFK